jgi:16S rRNA processing protein RimM
LKSQPGERRPAASGPPGGAAEGASETPRRLTVGRVGRPHGLDGSFYVTRPISRLLQLGAPLTVGESRTAEIVRRSGTDAHPIVRLAGVDDRDGAQALRGQQLTLASDRAPALEPGEWWEHELVGCEVRDGQTLLGTVSGLLELPSCEALEVTPAAGGSAVLVPLVKDAIRSMQPRSRRIEVDLEFLDLGGEGSAE